MMNKKELIAAVELAWAVASEAKISPNPIMLDANGSMDTIRWNTYLSLLGSVITKKVITDTKVEGGMNIRQEEPRENWQGDDN